MRSRPLTALLLLLFAFSVSPVHYVSEGANAAYDFSCTTVTQVPRSECEALVALYNSTNGSNWSNNSGWLVTNTPCSWERVGCLNGHVAGLSLQFTNLDGTIPPALGNLSYLVYLNLENNRLNGRIPPELGNLGRLEFLYLDDNILSGSIPHELGNLTNLQQLNLSRNVLTGSIPPQLGNLRNLWAGLLLSSNFLSGTIPIELGQLTNLEFLDLAGNRLTGSIPREIGNLTKLWTLWLGRNQLTGGVPPELGSLTQLLQFTLADNPLGGALPASLTNLANLRNFDFHETGLCEPSSSMFQNWLGGIPYLFSTDILCDASMAFSPTLEGYSFSNSDPEWGQYPTSAHDFQQEDAIRMFGRNAVCVAGTTSYCQWRHEALLWHNWINWYLNYGHCDGFSSTSLRFFKNQGNPPSYFQSSAQFAHDLTLSNARRHISYFWAHVTTDPVWAALQPSLSKTPRWVLAQISMGMRGNASDPRTLYLASTESAHAVTPYRIENQGNGVYRVRVYDSNYPNDTSRYVTIDAKNNTWVYGAWSGNASDAKISAAPVSLYGESPQCPWCRNASELDEPQNGQVSFTGPGHLLLTNAAGQRIGFVDDEFINEIPNASSAIIPGGLGIPTEPLYTVPLDSLYDVLVDGRSLTQAHQVSVSSFGPGFFLMASEIAMTPSDQDHVMMSPDGTRLAFRSGGSEKEVTLTVAHSTNNESYRFDVTNVDVGSTKAVTLTTDFNTGWLTINNDEGDDGFYDITIERAHGVGPQMFVHSDLVLTAGDTFSFDFERWMGTGPMTLYIDLNSDGTIDDTVVLQNQVRRVSLPFISVSP